MPTVHVKVMTERTATRIADWADERTFEHYFAPMQNGYGVDHVTLNDVDPDGLEELRSFIRTNDLRCTITLD